MKPFRFLDDQANVDALCHALHGVGLEPAGVNGETLVFTCHWLPTPIELAWSLSWWPDGENREDSRISLVRDGSVTFECDVASLLRQKHSQPLPVVIIELIARACGDITGRRFRRADTAER